MNADELIRYLSWAIYSLIFLLVAVKAVRRPVRANVDIALLFAGPAIIIATSTLVALGILLAGQLVTIVSISSILFMAYMLLRLVDDFTNIPTWVMRSAEAVLALAILATVVFTTPPTATFPPWLSLLMLAYLLVVLLYTIVAFIQESHKSRGVTRRRMRAVAGGSIWLCVTFLISGLGTRYFPEFSGLWTSLSDMAGLGSSISYYIGFATPGLLRRAWQEPDLRAFLGRAASLPRLPNTEAIISEMERGAALSVGAPNASIGLWDEAAQLLRFKVNGRSIEVRPEERTVSIRVFLTQKAMFSDNLQRDNPAHIHLSRVHNANTVLSAPITAGEKRIGVLAVYAPRAPIFAEEDLALVQLLADQAAVMLESRALIDGAASVRAREEVTRLKDDFLSAAAHDLKTPLTTLVGQSQLMERRAIRNPNAPADLASIQKMVREAQRLKTLVLELLDASRTEQGKLVSARERVDLAELAREICSRYSAERHDCDVDMRGSVVGMYDAIRIRQLIENLVENAYKYSPDGGKVCISAQRRDEWNQLTVSDEGIGIPAADLLHIFDRFHRATNVDDRRFAGMGLGLFICRGIVEEHGGRIWVTSTPGRGSTFHVNLPAPAEVDSETPIEAPAVIGGNLSLNGK